MVETTSWWQRVRQTPSRLQKLLWDPKRHSFVVESFRVVAMTLWKFDADLGLLRASALTYTSLLSLVPILAIMFAVLKGLGVQDRLEPLLLEHVAIGNAEVVTRILGYVDRTKVGALGVIGVVFLLITSVSVLGNIERSFNNVWQVPQGRHLLRKVADYIALLVVGPVLLFVSISLTTTLQSSAVLDQLYLVGDLLPVFLRLLPLVAIWLAFTAAYLIMPNRRVPLVSALVGGVVAGTAWHLAEWMYIRFQFGMARYNAIYGAMAQLPMLLVWIYVSWCIVLVGAELAFVHHLPGRGRYLKRRDDLWMPRLDTALGVLAEVARRFERGLPAPRQEDLAATLGFHASEIGRLVNRLTEMRLLVATQDDPPAYLPSRSPDRTPLAELLDELVALSKRETKGSSAVLAEIKALLEREYGTSSWADLGLELRDRPVVAGAGSDRGPPESA